jgi:DNA-binding GntR family transcriptional regulator
VPDFRTDTQKVADELRESILQGEFSPGDRLPQRSVAERFGTTTIVAREALRAIAGEGLVIVEPRFGAMVEEVTSERLRERYIVREALEGMAARLAASNILGEERNDLVILADECDRELPGDKLSRHDKGRLHTKLHEFIVVIARSGELQRLLNGIYLHSMIVANAYHIDWKNDEAKCHRTLVDPIVKGDGDKAEEIMRVHVRRGLEMELGALGKNGTKGP